MKYLNKNDILPCGCGGKPLLTDFPLYGISCPICDICVLGFEFETPCIQAWNLICNIERNYNEELEKPTVET